MTAILEILKRLLAPFLLPVGGIALAGLAVALFFAKADARHWKKLAENETALRQADREAWKQASFQATYDALINVYRVNAQRAKIDERTIHALADDRDRAASGYDRLRTRSAAYLRSPGQPDLSAEREATCRAVAGTGCDAIPPLLKAAQDNTDQLLRLIGWAKSQGEVQTAPPLPEGPTP